MKISDLMKERSIHMRRAEMRWQQENRRSYYEGYYRAQAMLCSVKDEKELKRASLDAVLFVIIKGLLVCLFMVVILASLCSAAPSTERTATFPNIYLSIEEPCCRPTGGGSHGLRSYGNSPEMKSSLWMMSPEAGEFGLSDRRCDMKTDKQVIHSP